MYISRRRLLLGATSALALASHAYAQEVPPTKALIIAPDSSGSINNGRYLLELFGTVNAFRSKNVVQAILDQRNGIDVLAFEWSFFQWLRVPWMRLRTKDDIERFCQKFLSYRRPTEQYCDKDFPPEFERLKNLPVPPTIGLPFDVAGLRRTGTFIGGAVATAASLFLPHHERVEKVIDISGDGPENVSAPFLVEAREKAIARGITINGLPIVDPAICYQGHDLLGYYEKFVMGGEGSFVEKANGMEDFERALRHKLVRELS